MGGWVAAEMAAMCRTGIKALILVGAAGIKPEQERNRRDFHGLGPDPHGPAFPRHFPGSQPRSSTSGNPPPMSSWWPIPTRKWPPACAGAPTSTTPACPTTWPGWTPPPCWSGAARDAIIPLECGELFEQALPNAQLKVIENCGHSPALEKPGEFLAAVGEFLGGV